VRSRRDKRAVDEALDELQQAAGSDQNMMTPIIRAVEAYATLGEISDRLRSVFGEYTAGDSE